jgi:MHS family proline/betaine transporter-like MFS transporter
MPEPLAEPAVPRASLTRKVVAGAVGNLLEWYDFGLFGFFAPVIARAFLPAEDRLASLLGTFGVFATGFSDAPAGRRSLRLCRRPPGT